MNLFINEKKKPLFLVTTWVLFFTVLILISNYITFNVSNNNEIKKIYYADHIFPVYYELIEEFNNQHKGKFEVVPVNLPSVTTNERKEVLSRYLRGNDIIDVFAVDQIWVKRFAKWALPLDEYFNKFAKDSLLSKALQSCYNEGELVAMPFNIDLMLMYYRKDKLAKFSDFEELKIKLLDGITWEEFIELSSRFAKDEAPYYIFQADDFEGLVISFIELLNVQGKELYEDDQLQLNTKEAEKALQLLVDFVNKYKISPPEVTQLRENASIKYFIENDGVFLRGWPNFIEELKERTNYQNIDEQIEMAAIPHFKGHKPLTILGGWNLMISKYSENKKEAVEFVKFLMSEKPQKKIFEKRNQLPTCKSVYSDKEFINNNKRIDYYFKLLSRGVYRPFREDYTKISDVISYYVYLAIKKEISVKEALKEASRIINLGQVVIR